MTYRQTNRNIGRQPAHYFTGSVRKDSNDISTFGRWQVEVCDYMSQEPSNPNYTKHDDSTKRWLYVDYRYVNPNTPTCVNVSDCYKLVAALGREVSHPDFLYPGTTKKDGARMAQWIAKTLSERNLLYIPNIVNRGSSNSNTYRPRNTTYDTVVTTDDQKVTWSPVDTTTPTDEPEPTDPPVVIEEAPVPAPPAPKVHNRDATHLERAVAFHDIIKAMRRNVADANLQVIVSPRAVYDGADMLMDLPIEMILEHKILGPLSKDDRARVMYGVKIPKYTVPNMLPEPGKHYLFPILLAYARRGKNVMLVGPAGSGKSTIARQIAERIAEETNTTFPCRVQPFSAQMMLSTLVGFPDANGKYHRTGLRDVIEHDGLFLMDEIDNGNPNTIAACNEMAACKPGTLIDFPDGPVAKGKNALVWAGANTFGTGPDAQYVGRNRLDAATLDRFFRIEMPYDEALETNVLANLYG